MYQFPIGAMLESFRLPTEEALKQTVSISNKISNQASNELYTEDSGLSEEIE